MYSNICAINSGCIANGTVLVVAASLTFYAGSMGPWPSEPLIWFLNRFFAELFGNWIDFFRKQRALRILRLWPRLSSVFRRLGPDLQIFLFVSWIEFWGNHQIRDRFYKRVCRCADNTRRHFIQSSLCPWPSPPAVPKIELQRRVQWSLFKK